MKKLKSLKSILLIVLIVFAIVRLTTLKSSKEEPTDVSYTTLIQLIRDENVSNIELTEGSSTVIAMLEDNSKVNTAIPNQDIFLNYLQNEIIYGNMIEISLKPKNISFTTTLANFLINAMIIIYAIGICIFGFKWIHKQITRKSTNNNNSFSSLANMLNTEINYIEKMVESDVRFSDVAGLDEEKQELKEVVDFIKNPEKYMKLGAKIPKGVLLSGNPGTGKTLLAKAVAGEAEVAYLSVSGSEFVEKYVGVGAQRVRGLFKEARKQAPCIIFIDEIDSIGSKRGDSNDERNQTLEQLLTEMDGFKDRTDIVILAATNRPDSLDPALVRPGRFDRRISVNLPDVKGRMEILQVHARDKRFLEDVDFYKIACNTAGYSGAELENLLNESALTAARNNHDIIHKSDIDEALKKILVGLQKNGRIISERERKITAVHEAGHAIVSRLLSTQSPVKEISIVPRGKAGGYTLNESIEDKQYISKSELKERVIVLLAGRAAENIFLNDISSGASNDLEIATESIRQMIMLYGMDDELGPVSYKKDEYLGDDTLNLIWEKIGKYLKECEEQAKKIINENKQTIDKLVELLLAQETVMGEEMEELFQ